jgi:DNA repair protein RecN (Recombination protein N)
VFDEVDAGIGGTAATAVGRSLARLGEDHQVLVVTHLPQVAAFADAQVEVRKDDHDGVTTTSAQLLGPAERVVEIARMLSGSPDSDTARRHAEELLTEAGHVPAP